MESEALRDFQGLVERVGGRQHLLLVGEARAGELETFARDLFAEPAKHEPAAAEPPQQPEAAAGGGSAARRARVRRGCGRPWRGCALLFALFRVGSLLPPRWRQERRRLREILRDVRSQLPSAPLAAVVGVAVAAKAAAPSERDGEEARLRLEALLRRVFRERRHPRPGLSDTLQAVPYLPGSTRGAAEAREAACRALRAALKVRAVSDGVETMKQRLPSFLRCIPWGRRNEHLTIAANKLNEDALQELEEAIALTNIAPNGNCEEASVGLDT